MCDQSEVQYTAGAPKDVTSLRNQLIQYYAKNIPTGAAEWKGGYQAPLNPMQQSAMRNVYQKMNQAPPQVAPPQGQGGQGGQGGQQTSFQGSPQEQMLRYLMAQRAQGTQGGLPR